MAGKFRAFVFGGIVGAGIALLFAPKTGQETRDLLTGKAEQLWGDGQDLYSQGWDRAKAEATNVQSTASKANSELKQKIENARSAIAEQVAKNAQTARDTISSQVPVAGEKINQAVDVVRGQIDGAASKLKTATADLAAKDAKSVTEESAAAPTEPAAEVKPATADPAVDVQTAIKAAQAKLDNDDSNAKPANADAAKTDR